MNNRVRDFPNSNAAMISAGFIAARCARCRTRRLNLESDVTQKAADGDCGGFLVAWPNARTPWLPTTIMPRTMSSATGLALGRGFVKLAGVLASPTIQNLTVKEDEPEEEIGSSGFWLKLSIIICLVLAGGVFAGYVSLSFSKYRKCLDENSTD